MKQCIHAINLEKFKNNNPKKKSKASSFKEQKKKMHNEYEKPTKR